MQVEFHSAKIAGSRSSHAIIVILASGFVILSGRLITKVRRPA
jgi:hypothetical protein